jgi:hypothetical protein
MIKATHDGFRVQVLKVVNLEAWRAASMVIEL